MIMEKTKMLITGTDGNEAEVEVISTFFNKDKTKQYIMYTKGEVQNENTIVYTSVVKKEKNLVYLEEITDDAEWAEVKNIIREMLS